MAYQEAYQSIKDIVAKRFQAVYHQQAIYEALMLGTEFSKIPDTAPLLKALKEKDKKATAEAIEDLTKEGDKFFNKDYSPEVDRKVSKQLIALYARLVPAEQHISIFKQIADKYNGSTDAFVDACFTQSVFSSKAALDKFLKNPNAETLEKDPMVCYAQSVKEGYQATSDAMKAETDAYNRAHKVWVAGMLRFTPLRG